MENVFHKKIWRTDAVQIHVDPLLIPLIKSKNDSKEEIWRVKMIFCRGPKLENSYL